MNRRGFTLLEILIATGTFMIVMVVAVGIFTLNVGSSSVTEQMRINAQSARFAFESISREIRLAHGLVYVESTTSKIAIPPFDIVPNGSDKIIRIYQAIRKDDNASGQATYSLSRRLYCQKPMANYTSPQLYQLVVMTQTAYDTTANPPATVAAIHAARVANTIPWLPANADCISAQVAGEPVTSKELATDQFTIVRSYDYSQAMNDISTLAQQPFIEIDMTVSNPRYNKNRDTGQQIRTTLRTMIVPRNFISPFDIGQVGVQGATE